MYATLFLALISLLMACVFVGLFVYAAVPRDGSNGFSPDDGSVFDPLRLCGHHLLCRRHGYLYTRSMTNRQIYEDLGKLGASKSYLYGTVKNQISRIFVVPIASGTTIIILFFTMILYCSNGGVSTAEVLSGRNCLLIVLGISVLFYGLYRFTLSRVCRNLGLKKQGTL